MINYVFLFQISLLLATKAKTSYKSTKEYVVKFLKLQLNSYPFCEVTVRDTKTS